MTSTEPPEEEISNFVSITNASRLQAISYLKAHDLNPQKAINAFYENPTGSQPQSHTDWGPFRSPYGNQDASAFSIENTDTLQNAGFATPPSRPPSRVTTNDSLNPAKLPHGGQNLTMAEREARDLRQAMELSLHQEFGPQETGITNTSNPHFSRATRDVYEESAWALTCLNPSSRDVIISPDPEDRGRIYGEPAFLRPSQESQYLGGLLTILHSIPLAREALLLRGKVLLDYGHDAQWWNGQAISSPNVASLEEPSREGNHWNDILCETQRLMAFLDSTERAFGSADALASIKSMAGYDSDGGVSKFLESWQEAAIRAIPENQLAVIFSSHALKRSFSELDTPIEKEFLALNSNVELEHRQTLYDVLDRTVWSDTPDEDLDDVWLEHVAEVLIIKLESSDSSPKSADVKIPAVLYLDRYLSACRDISRDFRSRRLDAYKEIYKLDDLMARFLRPRVTVDKGLSSQEMLEKAAAAACLALPMSGIPLTPEAANAEGQRLANELRAIAAKIDLKMKELEARKQRALETLRSYSKVLTEPSGMPGEPPHCKYTLRGVCTAPHVIYVLGRQPSDDVEDELDSKAREVNDDWQWWRISFSTDDGKTQLASKKETNSRYSLPRNADVAGYTTQKVREIEVLRAAREESNNVLLVYANGNAVNFMEDGAPVPLQAFVNTDNQAFRAEFQEAEHLSRARTPEAEGQSMSWNDNTQNLDGSSNTGDSVYDLMQQSTSGHQDSYQMDPGVPWSSVPASASRREAVNVFDYEVHSFDDDSNQDQDMEEKNKIEAEEQVRGSEL